MFKQKHILCEACADEGGVGGYSAVSDSPLVKPVTVKLKLPSGKEVEVEADETTSLSQGEVPVVSTFTVESEFAALSEDDMADLIKQVCAKTVILNESALFQDLSFLPEGVLRLDMSETTLNSISAYKNAPSTLNHIDFGDDDLTVPFPKLQEVLSMGIPFDMVIDELVMSNGQVLYEGFEFRQGILLNLDDEFQFSGVNSSEDKAEHEQLLKFLSRFGVKRYRLVNSTQSAGLANLPPSVESLVVRNCPALDVSIKTTKKSALRELSIENVRSVSSIKTVTTLDSLYIHAADRFVLTDQTKAQSIELNDVKNFQIKSIDDSVVESIDLSNAPQMPQIVDAKAGYKTTLNVELEALMLEEFKSVLNSPLKVNISMHKMSLGDGATAEVNLKVEKGEVVSKEKHELAAQGIKTKAQLKELKAVYDFLEGVERVSVEDCSAITAIADVDFGQRALALDTCPNLIVNETIPVQVSNLEFIIIDDCGEVRNLDTSALQNVELICVIDTPVKVTPKMQARELILHTQELEIDSAESFSKKVLRLHIDHYCGINSIGRGYYTPVDAPAEVLDKMPSHVQHNLKAARVDRVVQQGSILLDGLKQVKWKQLPGACKQATQLAWHKVTNGSVGHFLANKVKLPQVDVIDKGEDKSVFERYVLSIDLPFVEADENGENHFVRSKTTCKLESWNERKQRQKALKNNSQKSDDA